MMKSPSEDTIESPSVWFFTLPGVVAKPRQTRQDRWKQRPAVIKYRMWADRARKHAPLSLPAEPSIVECKAYLPLPASYNKKKVKELLGQPHRLRPDVDNILKAMMDALFNEDSMIHTVRISKFWCLSGEERLEVSVWA